MDWHYKHTVLALCTGAFFATMVSRLAVSPVVPAITAEFGVSNTLVGGALSGMWLTYALFQFPSGVLADRVGERRVILTAVAGTGVVTLLVALAPRFEVFFVGIALLGAVTGLHYSVATTLVTRIYDNHGTAIAIHNAGGPVAGLLTPVAVSWVAVGYGWRPAVGVAVVVAVPAFVLFARGIRPTAPRRPDRSLRNQFRPRPLVELLARPEIAFTTLIAIVAEFVWQGLTSFLPTFLSQYRGYSATVAGSLFAVYFVALGVLQVGVGGLADRYGRDQAILTCMVAGIAGLLVLTTVPGIVAGVVGVVLVGFGMGWSAAVFARFLDHLDDGERGTGFGLVRTVFMVVASAGSVAVGWLADGVGWAAAFGVLASLLAVVVAVLVVDGVRRRR